MCLIYVLFRLFVAGAQREALLSLRAGSDSHAMAVIIDSPFWLPTSVDKKARLGVKRAIVEPLFPILATNIRMASVDKKCAFLALLSPLLGGLIAFFPSCLSGR